MSVCNRGGPASVEQEVESWWWATTHAVQACWNKGSGGVVRALAVTGQMQNVIRLPKACEINTSPMC